jgi:hypothetical protein
VHTCSAANDSAIHLVGYLRLNAPVISAQVKLSVNKVPAVNHIAEFRHKG